MDAGGLGRRRGLAVDLAMLLAVALLLVAVHVLVPASIRAGLALSYAAPDPLHALTAAYVHGSDAHLAGNLGGYVAGAGLALALAHLAGERRWFRLSFLVYLTVVPIAVGFTGAAVIGRAVESRGFSAVVAAFVGFVLVATGVVLRRTFGLDRWLAWDVVAAMSIVVAVEILWAADLPVPTVGLGLLAVGLALTAVPLVRAGLAAGRPATRAAWTRLAGGAAVVVGLLAVVSWFVVGLFPADLAGPDGVTNILAHYLGLVYGAVVAAWGYRYWSTAPG